MLNKEQFMEILPHRPPMLLVDEIRFIGGKETTQ